MGQRKSGLLRQFNS